MVFVGSSSRAAAASKLDHYEPPSPSGVDQPHSLLVEAEIGDFLRSHRIIDYHRPNRCQRILANVSRRKPQLGTAGGEVQAVVGRLFAN